MRKRALVTAIALSFAAFAHTATAQDATPPVKMEKTVADLNAELNQSRDRVNALMKSITEPLAEKSYNDWSNETLKPLIEKMQSGGLPPKPAVKNQYGGYDADAWLTAAQEKEFLESSEFKSTMESTQKEYSDYLVSLNKAMGDFQSLAVQGEKLKVADVDAIKLPVLRPLTDKERSFMLSTNIKLWDSINKDFVDAYVRPQLERLKVLAQLNEEAANYERLNKAAIEKENAVIAKMNEAAATAEQTTKEALTSSGLTTDKNGVMIFNPQINVKMPEIKDFMANCYLLDEPQPETVEKPKPQIDVEEKSR